MQNWNWHQEKDRETKHVTQGVCPKEDHYYGYDGDHRIADKQQMNTKRAFTGPLAKHRLDTASKTAVVP
jgi:hypothetical protein